MLRPALLCAAITAVLLGTGPAAAAAPGDEDARWALDAVNAAAAWKVSKGAGVTVALLGGGQPDASLPGLSGRIELGPDLTGAAIGDDTVPPGDDATALASAIAGSGRGGGTPGIAPEARVLSVPVARSPSGGPGPAEPQDSPIARGIRYATGRGVKVICLPVPAYAVDRVERDAISFALSRGVVVVAAVGDSRPVAVRQGERHVLLGVPRGLPRGGGRRRRRPQGRQDRGQQRQPLGPGRRARRPRARHARGGRRGAVSGTGVASALVAGAIALIKAKYPNLPPELVSRALTATSRPRPSAGYDDKVGFGVIDAAAALRKAAELTEYGRTSSMRDDSVQDDAHFGRGPVAEGPATSGARSG